MLEHYSNSMIGGVMEIPDQCRSPSKDYINNLETKPAPRLFKPLPTVFNDKSHAKKLTLIIRLLITNNRCRYLNQPKNLVLLRFCKKHELSLTMISLLANVAATRLGLHDYSMGI